MFNDLFPKAKADELVMRSTLLTALEQWLKESGLTQAQAVKALGITQARVSDIKRGIGHAGSTGSQGWTQAKTEIGGMSGLMSTGVPM